MEYFGEGVRPDLYKNFMKAETPRELEQAMNKLFQERIKYIRISQKPFSSQIEGAKKQHNFIV